MADVALQSIVRQLRRFTAPNGIGALTDAQLLQRVVESRDEAAFEALVWRHGPLVLGTCRKLLSHDQDAEDAFQATFLTLARKAKSVVKGESLAAWLFQVASRIALRLRSQIRCRQAREQHDEDLSALAVEPAGAASVEQLDLWGVLLEELHRLPDRYRRPIISCYLEGKTHEVAARELARPLGSMSNSLARGCELLRARLTRRGACMSTGMLTALLGSQVSAALPSFLILAVVTAALEFSTGAAVSGPAASLANGVMRSMMVSKIKTAAGALLFLSVVAAGTVGLAHQKSTRPAIQAKEPEKATEKPQPAEEKRPQLDQQGDPLPEGALLRLGTIRFRHPGGVNGIAISPDGKSLVTEGFNALRLWDPATGKPGPVLRSAPLNYGAAQNLVTFSPDGRKVFFPRGEGVAAQDLNTGKTEVVFVPGEKRKFHAVHPSPDGRLLAVGTSDGVQVMELASGRVLWKTENGPSVPPPKDDRLTAFVIPYSLGTFAPDGKLVALHASDAPKTLRLLDPANGEEKRRIELGDRLFQMAFSSDSRQIATTERENAVRVYDVATGRRVHSWSIKLTNPFENYTLAVAFSPDGKTLAAGATDNLVHLWDLGTGRELAPLRADTWYVTGLVFDPKGQWLYSAGWGGAIRRWDVATWQERPVARSAATGTMARSPVGSLVVWEGEKGVLHLGDAATGKILRTLPGNPAGFSHLTFSPDGSILAAGGDDLSVQLWEVATGKKLRQWSWPKGKDPHACVDDMAFTPDGKMLATAGLRSNEVLLWDVQTGARLGRAPHPMAKGVIFAPDGRMLVSAGWDQSVRWWSMPDLKPVDAVSLPDQNGVARSRPDPRLQAIARSPDGRLLATIGLDGAFRIWDAMSRKLLRSFPAVKGQCNVAFSPDGQWLTAGGYHGEVGLWDVWTGEQILKLAGHPARIQCVAFGPDGRTLLTGSDDRTVLVWDLRPKIEAPNEPSVASLWDVLAGTDATAAYRAIWQLADRPDKSVTFLKEKLAPAKPINPKRLRELFDGLDSDQFADRETASKELAALGEAAEGDLRRELTKNPSAEKSRRLQTLLEGLASGPSSEDTQRMRAIIVLKWANTPEARTLLSELAQGAPAARLTTEAKAALGQLEHR
jgi:RNA polymerase sigma factor (sigma-70 family)